jgi:hypothetical protein
MVNDPARPVGMLSEAETAELVDRINAAPNLQPFTLEEAIHRARYLPNEPGPMYTGDQAYAGRIAKAVREWLVAQPIAPIPMVLHCPSCGTQHIDEATPEWPNPPHRSHLCSNEDCGTIWRPADVLTVGVAAIATRSACDNWVPGVQAERAGYDLRDEGDVAHGCEACDGEDACTCAAPPPRDEGDLLGGLVERQAVLTALEHHPACCDIVRHVPYARG